MAFEGVPFTLNATIKGSEKKVGEKVVTTIQSNTSSKAPFGKMFETAEQKTKEKAANCSNFLEQQFSNRAVTNHKAKA